MKANVYFAGAGGSSLGLENAGYTVTGYENWQPAIDTHRANGMACVDVDLSDPTIDATLPACDLAWFSPPCQPFSAAGDRQGEFDDRDGFPWTLRIIAATLPAVVIIENVKGLTFTIHADYFTGVLTSIRALGYHVEWKVLNCADYGVPQTRERTIIIARRDGEPITWPAPTHTEHPGLFTEPWVTMADALGWDGELSYNRGEGMTERHGPRGPWDVTRIPAPTVHRNSAKDWTLDTRRDLRDGVTQQRSLDKPAPALATISGQWMWTRPATTIAGDPRVSAHGRHDPDTSDSQQADAIRVTLPELAALQGFPPDYQWCGTRTAQAKQIGNAVPPRLAEVLANANRPALIPQ